MWMFWKDLWSYRAIVAPPPARPTRGKVVHNAELPAALPSWLPGTGFGTGKLDLGELTVVQITSFEHVWNTGSGQSGASYYNAVDIPDGYYSLGCYAQLNSVPLSGAVLAVKGSFDGASPPLAVPTDYTLLWASADWADVEQEVLAFFWTPVVPLGYKALGFALTDTPDKPAKHDIVLVREDLTELAVIDEFLWGTAQLSGVPEFSSWTTKPYRVGLAEFGIPANTVYCIPAVTAEAAVSIACLKNVNRVLDLMPTYKQLEQVMNAYGPRMYFHSKEGYLPATPQWFFDHGALLYSAASRDSPVRVLGAGSNLPTGGCNDGKYWLDFPKDGSADIVKKGNLSVAKVFVHVKPMFGGKFTDICCWIYHCYNGPSTARVGVLKSISLGKIGEHVSDWEHFVLRVDNFSGKLWKLYMAAHAAGTWYRLDELEFVAGNRAAVYSANNSHALYPNQGDHLQGDEKRQVGIRNDTERSSVILDTNTDFEFMNIDYLGAKGETGYPEQPPWVEFLREWGPKIKYDSKSELEKILRYLPAVVRNSVLDLLSKLPDELGGQEGPTGPKEKDSWYRDEKV